MLCPVRARDSSSLRKDPKITNETGGCPQGADDRSASSEFFGNRVDVYFRSLRAWVRGRQVAPLKIGHVTVEFDSHECTLRKTCMPDSDSIWMPMRCATLGHQRDPLSEYLLGACAISVPAGYTLETEDGVEILVHKITGIRCCAKPFPVGWRREVEQPIVLYHYTTKDAFKVVARSNFLFVSTKLATDCDFGVGHYATSQPPHAFTSISETLCNNYPRMLKTYGLGHPNFPTEERAAYCIPLFVDYDWLPALPLSDPSGPRGAISESRDRLGFDFDASRHDIWFVDKSMSDKGFCGMQDKLEIAFLGGAEQGQVDVVEACLRDGVDIDAVNERGDTALILAACWGHVDVVNTLISVSVRVDATTESGRSALMLAAFMSAAEVVDVLLASGARVNAVDNTGATPLIWACCNVEKETPDVVKALLGARASVNAADSTGSTALMRAAYMGAVSVADALLESGSSVQHVDSDGYTAHSWASWCQDVDAKSAMITLLATWREDTT